MSAGTHGRCWHAVRTVPEEEADVSAAPEAETSDTAAVASSRLIGSLARFAASSRGLLGSSTSRVQRPSTQPVAPARAAATAPVRSRRPRSATDVAPVRGAAGAATVTVAATPGVSEEASPERSPQLTGELAPSVAASGASQTSTVSPPVEAGSQQPLLSKADQLSQLVSGAVAARMSEEGLPGDRSGSRAVLKRANVYTPGVPPAPPPPRSERLCVQLMWTATSVSRARLTVRGISRVAWGFRVLWQHLTTRPWLMCGGWAADTASLHVSGGRRNAAKSGTMMTTDSSASSVRSSTRQTAALTAPADSGSSVSRRRGRGSTTRRVRARAEAAAAAAAAAAPATTGTSAPMAGCGDDDDKDSPRVKFVCCMSPLRMPRRLKGWTTPQQDDVSVHSAPR